MLICNAFYSRPNLVHPIYLVKDLGGTRFHEYALLWKRQICGQSQFQMGHGLHAMAHVAASELALEKFPISSTMYGNGCP
jgi:hypothetical protein